MLNQLFGTVSLNQLGKTPIWVVSSQLIVFKLFVYSYQLKTLYDIVITGYIAAMECGAFFVSTFATVIMMA